ncbi:MAG: alpha-L-rhamnosidase C-terminal domain-containing protein [Bacteroidota bacterium]
MFGSIDEGFYRSLPGINAASPGFKQIIIKPQSAGGIHWATGSYHSVRGLIKSAWRQQDNHFSMQVSVLPNTSALVFISSAQYHTVTENGTPVKILRYEKGYAVVESGSGDYMFSVN